MWPVVALGLGWAALSLLSTRPIAAGLARRGRRLLDTAPTSDLPLRVAQLTATRAAALDAHATELRRIERSLHDGTQNRLVAVTVLLGAARRALARDPAAAEEILERAQAAAEQALAELRSVARGILPPVLADRGLAGALAGLAASSAVPCSIEVDVPVRCAASVEATAWFLVAEALTNAARHSGAGRIAVTVHRRGDQLHVTVTDDGRGGARDGAGSGLVGIRRRVEAHDGTLTLSSAAGGPTTPDRGAAVRIVIAEDDALLREGLALLLRAEQLDVVATAGTPEQFLTALDAHRPDVAIVDVRMPPTHTDEGIVAAVQARRRRPDLAVLVLSAHVEQTFATELLATGAAGLGYLLKERVGRVEQFLDALHRVAAGGTAIDPELVAALFARTRTDQRLARLSPRELEVLALMAEGLGNTAIGQRLVVTDGAVHKHIRSIFAKLELPPDDSGDRRVTAVLRYLDDVRRRT